MLIEKRGGVVTIQEGGKTSSSSQAQTLLRARTGVNLPVENLYYWVRGIPAPGAKSVQKDQHHRITELQQAGFLIRYGAYASIKGQILPTHIQVQGQGVFLKLVVKQWKI
jgi:outer membrane lipoprotein LolB